MAAQEPEDTGLGVSLSHDETVVLCVAGAGPQGCDVLRPPGLDGEQWQLLTGRHFPLVQVLERRGEPREQAGSRVWGAYEAALKATGTRELHLTLERIEGDSTLFRATGNGRSVAVLTFPKRLTRGGLRMVAVVLAQPASGATGEREADGCWSDWLAAGHRTADWFGLEALLAGPPADRRIVFRFPLAFKDAANLDRTLYFTRLFDWMGRLREMALRPVLPRLAPEFRSGEWAWVTNRSWASFSGPVQGGEVLEASVRFLDRGGPEQATVDVGFDWQRVGPHGARTPVAESRIQVTWARVKGHGQVVPAPYPDYLDRFFREFMGDQQTTPATGERSRLRALEQLGPVRWQATPGPGAGILLGEETTATSLGDANLVGNVYYTKYYDLQGLLRDRCFLAWAPEAFRGNGEGGGPRCLHTTVEHLRDAMPFDSIRTRVRLLGLYPKGVELTFDFHRVLPTGQEEKLASGSQVVGWQAVAEGAGGWRLLELPETVMTGLSAAIAG